MIRIIQTAKSYRRNPVLTEVNLTCEKGKIQALLGENGSGKTTLVNIISGFIKSDKGEIFINEKKVTPRNYHYRNHAGYVLETPLYLDKLSAREFLTFLAKMYNIPNKEYTKKIEEILQFFDLPLDNKKYIESYSKGMKQKVSLAAAILHEPDYLVLDEPFNGLDFISLQNFSQIAKQMAHKGCTILITSHQFDAIASLCDRLALLKDGKIAFNKSIEEIEKEAQKSFPGSKEPAKMFLEHWMNEKQKPNLSWI